MEGHRKVPRGRGVLKAKFLEAMYENKLEFPVGGGGGEGVGVQNKKPSIGGVWIFSGTAHFIFFSQITVDTLYLRPLISDHLS